MKKQKELLVIIPAHNEEENIHKVLEQLKDQKIGDIADILVIDDASADGTGHVVKEARCMLIRNVCRSGYGNSLRLGYRYALREDYRYVIQMDADGQHDVCNIPSIYRRLREKDEKGYCPDIVLASRFMEGSPEFRVGIFKRTAYIWFRLIIRILTGRRIADPTTGLQGLNRRAFSFYADHRNFDNKYPDANIVIQMLLLGFYIAEIPAVMHARVDGESMHKGFSAFWYMCRMLFDIPATAVRIRLLKRDEGKLHFRKAEFKENNEELYNPGRGWYHLYPFVIPASGEISLEEAHICLRIMGEKEQLAMLRINICAFRSCEITDEALSAVRQIFGLFCAEGKQMIVRFVYDDEGRGMEWEPGDIFIIKRHMEQLGAVVCEFSEDILVLQGIFTGSWGEMHHTKFSTVSDMSELIRSLDAAVKRSCYLAVRTPVQQRDIIAYNTRPNRYEKREDELSKRLGLFNDGMFGSDTDLGTYREGTREEELNWQDYSLEHTPNGGETVAGERLVSSLKAAEDMSRMHITYLNSAYHEKQLDYWREERVMQNGCWKGLSGYEYIGRHLGYRFVIRDAEIIQGKTMRIIVENCGFARLYERADCFLVAEKAGGHPNYIPVDTDARRWKSGGRTVLEVSLPPQEEWMSGDRIYFQMKRKRDGRVIRLANQGAEDMVLLGAPVRYKQ